MGEAQGRRSHFSNQPVRRGVPCPSCWLSNLLQERVWIFYSLPCARNPQVMWYWTDAVPLACLYLASFLLRKSVCLSWSNSEWHKAKGTWIVASRRSGVLSCTKLNASRLHLLISYASNHWGSAEWVFLVIKPPSVEVALNAMNVSL